MTELKGKIGEGCTETINICDSSNFQLSWKEKEKKKKKAENEEETKTEMNIGLCADKIGWCH